jgi:bifunctional UDP-N-acetylglucosamine pyrophosphorylase/glucosamine-1-phosphate N-acetyltransferase
MISAIVMAAGKGTRMDSELTKTMHLVGDRPMVEHVYTNLIKAGVDNIVFVVGHGADQIKECLKDKVTYAIQDPQLGSGHAVMQATSLKQVTGTTLIVNGDCPLVQPETYQMLIKAAQEYKFVDLTTCPDDTASYGRIVRDAKGQLEQIVEYKDCTPKQREIKEINVGIYAADNQLLWEYLPEITNDNEQHEYYITDLVAIFRKHGYPVGAVTAADWQEMSGINTRTELVVASRWLNNRVCDYWLNHGVTVVDPQNTYIGTDVQIGKDTTIYPNCHLEGKTVIGTGNTIEEGCHFINAVIGNDNIIRASRITDSSVGNQVTLGPWAHLRNGCAIHDHVRIGNFVEMKNTTIDDGTKCSHLTYVGDATVGKAVNFGCGVVTVNYDGKHKFRTVIDDGAFIGSNANLIAPVHVGTNALVAAGSTINHDVNAGDMAIGRVRQENKAGYGTKYKNK